MIIISLLFLLFLVYVIVLLSYSMFWGAPFAPLSHERIKTMLKLLKPVKGKRFVDLGAGDGRIMLEASRIGLKSYGYEINPLLVFFCKSKA